MGSPGRCSRQGASKHRVRSRLLAYPWTRRLSPFGALVSTPAAPHGNRSLCKARCGTSRASWYHGVKKIRWKECENELWPCKHLLLRSSLAARPSVSRPSAAQGMRRCGGLCRDTATSAADTHQGRTGSPLPLLLLLALKFHLSSKQHLLPSTVQIPWHVPSRQHPGADGHLRRELLSW